MQIRHITVNGSTSVPPHGPDSVRMSGQTADETIILLRATSPTFRHRLQEEGLLALKASYGPLSGQTVYKRMMQVFWMEWELERHHRQKALRTKEARLTLQQEELTTLRGLPRLLATLSLWRERRHLQKQSPDPSYQFPVDAHQLYKYYLPKAHPHVTNALKAFEDANLIDWLPPDKAHPQGAFILREQAFLMLSAFKKASSAPSQSPGPEPKPTASPPEAP